MDSYPTSIKLELISGVCLTVSTFIPSFVAATILVSLWPQWRVYEETCRDHISQTLLDANHSLFSGQAQLLFFRTDMAIQREREPLSLKLSEKMNPEKGIQLVSTQRKRVSSQNKCQCNHRPYLFRNKVPMKWRVRSTGQHSRQASRHWYKEC